jgi:uncharacterized membrane protein
LFQTFEQVVYGAVQWLRLGLEGVGALVILAGAVRGVLGLVGRMSGEKEGQFEPVRLTLARYLSLALEFQLAADVLSTSIAPSWDQIGKLAAIAVIRTGLNYFLGLEVKAESGAPPPGGAGPVREQANPPAPA